MECRECHIKGIPPAKQTSADEAEKLRQEERATALRKAPYGGYTDQEHPPLDGNVALSITYKRGWGKSDAANIIGGIADALQRVFYLDDAQLVEINYKEERGEEDEYWIKVEER